MAYTASLLPAPDDRRMQLANYLTQQGLRPQITATGPAGIVQGLAGLAQAFAGRRLAERDREDREARRNTVFDQLATTLGTGEDGQPGSLDPRYMDLARAMEANAPGSGIDFLVGEATRRDEFMKPIEVNGRLVDPRDPSRVLADYSTVEPPKTREVRRGGLQVTEEFDPTTGAWKVIGEGPAFAPSAPDEPNRIESEIAALTAQGFDQPTAESIAYGWVKVSPPDQFGNVYLIDLRTGESQPTGRMAQGGEQDAPAAVAPAAAAATTPPANAIAEAAEAGTGPGATALRWADRLFGGFVPGDGQFGPETQAAKQEIRTFNQIAKSALVNNPRFPVAEQDLVANLLPDPDAFFTNPATEAQKARQLEQTLGNLKAQYQGTLSSGTVAQETQVEMAAKIAEIDRVLALMHTPASTGQTMEIDGTTVEVIGPNLDGSLRVRDPATGRTGTYRP